MKNITQLALMSFFIVLLTSCSEESTSKDPIRNNPPGGDVAPDDDDDDDNNSSANDDDDDNDNNNSQSSDGDDDDDNDNTPIGDDDDDDTDEDDKDIFVDPVGGTDTEQICNSIDLNLEAAPIRIMVLQDLSSSMRQGTPPKWAQAKEALKNMLTTYDNAVDFGFDGFPNSPNCTVQQPPFSDTKAHNAEAIIEHIDSIVLSSSTPLYKAMANYQTKEYAPEFLSMGATRYLLIVSDGRDTCGTAGGRNMAGVTNQQIGDLTTALLNDMGVMSYVIGFGAQAAPAQLNTIAAAGGTNVTEYFNAQDQEQLEKALNDIVGMSVACVYDIGEQDEDEIDLDKVNFYFDGKTVGFDEGCKKDSGWNWTDDKRTKIEFCKKACNKLKKRKVKEVSATFGCPTIPVVIV